MLYSVLAIEFTSCDILLKVSFIIMDLLGSCHNFDFSFGAFYQPPSSGKNQNPGVDFYSGNSLSFI